MSILAQHKARTPEALQTPTLPELEDNETVTGSQRVRPWWSCAEAAAFITGADSLIAAQQRFNAVFAQRPELAITLAQRNRIWGTYLSNAKEIFWLTRHADTLAGLGFSAESWIRGVYQ